MDNIEKQILEIIDSKKNEIIEFGEHIWNNAELGYKEYNTSSYFANFAKELGMKTSDCLAVTGVKAYLGEIDETKPTIALIGEMDALPSVNHPNVNKETGAVHSCGHNAQMAGIMGAMIALSDPKIKPFIDGNIVFFAVPAEEFIEIEYKNELRKKGKIKYGGGKCELIRIGAFSDIDIAIGHHILPNAEIVLANGSTNGFVNKVVRFEGKSSHAAEAPEEGIDALNAATLAMHALDQQRESFRDQDAVRVHGFISYGGEAMNIIAEHTVLEYSVRAKNIDAFQSASNKFDRAMKAGAMANGCAVEITTLPGYLPTVPVNRTKVVEEALQEICETTGYKYSEFGSDKHTTGSTDFGDLSSIIPLLQFKTGGFRGNLHTDSFQPVDKYLAYVVTAKAFALIAYKLLKNEHNEAKKLMDTYRQLFDKEEYIKYMDQTQKIEMVSFKEE